ncbi:MAG: uncharacterized protein QOK37_1464 [Thermoanaerobaculia bacterium]|jgi:uncharacterized protein (TIGR01777 family)|nr:uncharacterized protein [Thermoanaerobaculia bacterium]
MKIVIAGGTGHLGSLLTEALRARGDDVVVLSRNTEAHAVRWDGKTLGPWASAIDGADVVINLAGRSVDCRYSERHRREIMRSRIDSTRIIGEAIARAASPPATWLQMSTATIYSHRFDAANDERSGVIGGAEPDTPPSWKFSIDVARAWEEAIDTAPAPHTRKVKMRTAMVMAIGPGGPFAALRRHVMLGCGRLGNGRQYMSWIHERDFVRAVEWLIGHEEIEGAINLAAPEPLPNSEFISVLGNACGASFAMPVSEWMVDAGAFLMRTEPELVLKSRRVVPTRLLESGFQFDYPQWPAAARDLCARRAAPAEGRVW